MPRPISIPTPITSTTASQHTTTSTVVPRMYQLTAKDAEEVAQRLQRTAMRILITHPVRDDCICIGASSFLPRKFIDRITTDFLLITTESALRQRMDGWRFEWDEYGPDLWRAVCELHGEFSKTLRERHEASNEKRRETAAQKREQDAAEAAQVRKDLEDAGLDKHRSKLAGLPTFSKQETSPTRCIRLGTATGEAHTEIGET
ncbi:WVD2 family protein [Phanerochaete sordida]|uniref:WVD2 family protein n=1 Tax=Phanerochaete sordida TaxID=48140 RepID=A0A9P3G7E8_9APHY|nr:WVD2 family protein [Phanerochaete sordida]